MNVTVNGEARVVRDGSTLANLLADQQVPQRGAAAAVDGMVVPRGEWPTFVLAEGQAVEVLIAVQGG